MALPQKEQPPTVVLSPNLGEWESIGSFDTAQACQKELEKDQGGRS
jgi:hypothetical protein